MRPFARTVILVGTLAAAPAVLARSPVPIVERPDVQIVTGSGKPMNSEALRKAIVSGGAAGRWHVVPAADGKSLRGTYKVGTKHMVTVEIVPGPDSFSVKYVDSVNMNYRLQDGTAVIHPNYNLWVNQLVDSIRAEFKNF